MSAEDSTELRRRLHQMTVLHEVTTRIVSALDADEVVAGVLDSLGELVTYERAAINLLERHIPATPEEGPVSEAMVAKHTVGHMLTGGAVQLVVPLVAGGRALGALEVSLREPLGVDDVKILELLAAAAAVALQNAHLYQETQRLATTDALTGLSNYRHFHDLLGLEVQRARRMEYPVGLLVMDVDHFKLVNDRHGHPVGDFALQRVAEQLRKRLRRTDVIGRIGGEEFAVVLPGDGVAEVELVAEKLRRAVEQLPPVEGGTLRERTSLTLSVGGASLPSAVVEAQVLLSCADRALYEAKRSGRNQVRVWSEPNPPRPDVG